MTLSKGKGGRKSTETEAQRARDMWIARRASESSLLNEDKGPLPTTGDVDALIEWNALSTKRHGRSVRLANDPPVSQELTRFYAPTVNHFVSNFTQEVRRRL